MLGVVLMLLIWIKDNIPNGRDMAWFKAGGGLIGDAHPPAARFNGGQKVIFWTVILGGAALTISGLMLLFPFTWTGLEGLQTSNIVHGVVGMIMIAAMLAHIYIGSVGMEGAFDAMGSGEVDLNWAKEHHSIWVEDELKKRAGVPAGGKPMAAE
jgi:formate dehydrogenase subunit gamma